MTESYYEKMRQATSSAYLKRVVAQPTKPASVKAVVDKASPTGISQDKRK